MRQRNCPISRQLLEKKRPTESMSMRQVHLEGIALLECEDIIITWPTVVDSRI